MAQRQPKAGPSIPTRQRGADHSYLGPLPDAALFQNRLNGDVSVQPFGIKAENPGGLPAVRELFVYAEASVHSAMDSISVASV